MFYSLQIPSRFSQNLFWLSRLSMKPRFKKKLIQVVGNHSVIQWRTSWVYLPHTQPVRHVAWVFIDARGIAMYIWIAWLGNARWIDFKHKIQSIMRAWWRRLLGQPCHALRNQPVVIRLRSKIQMSQLSEYIVSGNHIFLSSNEKITINSCSESYCIHSFGPMFFHK